jgi:hypothetical protein
VTDGNMVRVHFGVGHVTDVNMVFLHFAEGW